LSPRGSPSFEVHLGAGTIAVAGERTRDPAMPAPHPTAVAIMLELGCWSASASVR
jgi:hypothetical protein